MADIILYLNNIKKMQYRLGKKGFTLIEIVIALSVLLIIASLAIFGYNSMVDKARRKVCEGNLKALTNAIEYYSVEFDALPATLGNLHQDHFDKAFARMMEEHPVSNRFYGAIARLGISGESHAAFLTYDKLKPMATEDNFKDPDDSNGGISYGINSSLTGKKWSEIGDDDLIVADSDSATFTGIRDIVSRHSRGITSEHIAMAFTKGKELLVFSERVTSSTGNSTQISVVTTYFDNLLTTDLSGEAADQAEDVRNKLYQAMSELSKATPDTASAISNITEAKAIVQDMINHGLIDPASGATLINHLQTVSSQI